MTKCECNAQDLCSGLFSDVMDKLGFQHQIATGFKRNKSILSCFGRARTIKLETCPTVDENIRTGLAFIGTLQKGDILLVEGSREFAYFGELMTKLTTRQGAAGVIIDGLTRDTNYTFRDDVTLPVFAKGYSPVDIKGRGRVESVDVLVHIGGIAVHPGDFIFVDNEAVCIVPEEIEDVVMLGVKNKINDEKRISELIHSGMEISELMDNVTEF